MADNQSVFLCVRHNHLGAALKSFFWDSDKPPLLGIPIYRRRQNFFLPAYVSIREEAGIHFAVDPESDKALAGKYRGLTDIFNPQVHRLRFRPPIYPGASCARSPSYPLLLPDGWAYIRTGFRYNILSGASLPTNVTPLEQGKFAAAPERPDPGAGDKGRGFLRLSACYGVGLGVCGGSWSSEQAISASLALRSISLCFASSVTSSVIALINAGGPPISCIKHR